MTNIAITHTWQQITTPSVFQVQGGRIGVYVGDTPNTASPLFILQTLDYWENTTSDVVWVRTLEASDTSYIVLRTL